MIDEFALAGSHPSFCRAVLPRAPECRSFRRDAKRLDRLRDPAREDRVDLEDQIGWRNLIGERLAELLADPLSRRIGRNTKMDKRIVILRGLFGQCPNRIPVS